MRRLLVLVVAVFFGFNSFGQVKIGLKLTPNFSWSQTIPNGDSLYLDVNGTSVAVGEVKPNGLKLRGGAGVIVDLNMSDNFAFATGVEYMTKGAGFKLNDSSITYSLQYLQIPLGIKVFTNEVMDYTKVYFQVGITQNINIGAKVNGNKTFTDSTGSKPFTENISLLETSLAIGTGIEMELGESTVVLAGITYNRGLMNIDATDTFKSPNKLSNGYLGIDVGLKF